MWPPSSPWLQEIATQGFTLQFPLSPGDGEGLKRAQRRAKISSITPSTSNELGPGECLSRRRGVPATDA
jgi:hypothetical protein